MDCFDALYEAIDPEDEPEVRDFKQRSSATSTPTSATNAEAFIKCAREFFREVADKL
jgi:hypothetical protein